MSKKMYPVVKAKSQYKKSEAKEEFDNVFDSDEEYLLTELDKANALVMNDDSTFGNSTGTLDRTKLKLVERKKHIIDLHVMGISPKTIMEQVNKLSAVRGWASVESEQSIKTIISTHFKTYNTPENGDFNDHIEGLKHSMFAQQEHLLEKATLIVTDKTKKWVPFEQMSAIKELYLMRDKMIENRNWNESKYNPNASQHNTSNQVNVFIDNSSKISFGEIKIPELEQLKKILQLKFDNK